ncbi:MAG: hypothetical protein Alpg2KO_16960 [Alphaproteobacteria bacterium]
MDRALLSFLIGSGPSRKFDVGTSSMALDPELMNFDKILFNTVLMNRSILFKYREPGMSIDDENGNNIPMLIYIPYEHDKPELGGESFFFSRRNFDRFFADKTDGHDNIKARLEEDYEILAALAELPTLSPYLVAEQLNRRRIELPDNYLELPGELNHRIRSRLRQRLRPLVCAAFSNTTLQVDLALEEFVDLVIEADDLPGLLPLATALRLKPDNALQAFAAWAGITYFEDEFHRIQEDLEMFATWICANPLPRSNLPSEVKQMMMEKATTLRNYLREDWGSSRGTLTSYKDSYSALISDNDPTGFVRFLGGAPGFYWELGDILGRLEQLLVTWRIKCAKHGQGPWPYEALDDFYYITNRTFMTSLAKQELDSKNKAGYGLSGAA